MVKHFRIMKPIHVGIIGYGWVATAHIDAINALPQAKVTAVHSTRPQDPAELSARHGGSIRFEPSLEAMLSDPDIQVVSICGYPGVHAAQAIAAAKAGKHIILEKPIALTWEECLAVEQAVNKAGVQVCVCFECRFSAQFLSTRALLDSGMLGAIHYGEIDYYHGIGPWYGQYRWNIRKDAAGSSLLSAGCHALDALLLCMDGDVAEVHSLSTRSANKDFQAYEYNTTSVTLIRFQDGRVGKTASVIDCLQPYYFHTHLIGSEGSLLDNQFHSNKLGALNKNQWSRLSFSPVDSGDVKDHPYQTQFDAFFQALQNNVPMPLTSLKEAMRTHKVLFAADASAASGKPVTV